MALTKDPRSRRAAFGDDSTLEWRRALARFGQRTRLMPHPPLLFHVTTLGAVAGMLILARSDPAAYRALLQEDRLVEWWTVTLFLAAGTLWLRRALPERRVFDLGVALFCLVVAGEEISWGQRLMGFTPPAPFLEYNEQQELTVHNFAALFGKPKSVLVLVLGVYGLLLPALALPAAGRRLLTRAGATAPSVLLVPWFALAVGLLIDYPFDFTGEWVELLAATLFLAAARPRPLVLGSSAAGALVAAIMLTTLVGWRPGASGDAIACVRHETAAIARDLASGAAQARLVHAGRVHKRLASAAESDYLDRETLHAFVTTPCPGVTGDLAARRHHGLDPWGMAYWIRTDGSAADSTRRVTVYSFGPDRRRHIGAGSGGDDITATRLLISDTLSSDP